MKTKIMEAVARGWCSEENKHKVMDEELVNAIVKEVLLVFEALPELPPSATV